MEKIWNEKKRKPLALGLAVLFFFLLISIVIEVIDHFDTVEEQARGCIAKSPEVAMRTGTLEKVDLIKRFYFGGPKSRNGAYREYLYAVKGASGQARFSVEIDRKNVCHIREVK